LPRPDRQVAKFEEYVKHQFLPSTAPVKIAIGVNLEGQLVEADLSDPNTCHFLVGGTTGSGKSEFLRSLLLSLLVRHSPQNLKIVLVDPNVSPFPNLSRYRGCIRQLSKKAIALLN
jgi:S-DNA-T family DNA segregation ATPase FtsK/SpoIIIE